MRRSVPVAKLLLLALIMGANFGCSSSNQTAGGSFVNPGIVDLAIGDLDENNTPTNSKVFLYYNVLNAIASGGTLAPDVTLDNATSLIQSPRSVVLTTDDLYVLNHDGFDNIAIFRNYLSLASNSAPDAVLDVLADMNSPRQMLVSETDNTIVVADDDDDEVLLFRSASAIAADVAPDVTLDNAGSAIAEPKGIALLEDATSGGNVDLFVANNDHDSTGTETVTIYRDIATLVDGDPADVILSHDTSFFALGCRAKKVDVLSNTLYVATENCGVFIFNDADSLLTDDLPDVQLSVDGAGINAPLNMEVANNVLWVADRRYDFCGERPGTYGFFPADDLVDGMAPSVSLNFIEGAHQIEAAGGGLFINEQDNCSFDFGRMHFYVNSASAAAGFFPDATIQGGIGPGDTDLLKPVSISVIERDSGT